MLQISILLPLLGLAISTSLAIHLPSPDECGQSTFQPWNDPRHQMRIVGGQRVAKGSDLPWQAYLNKTMSVEGFDFSTMCGATIISPRWLLTAAHCVWEFKQNVVPVRLEAILGTVDLLQAQAPMIRMAVLDVIYHKEFDFDFKLNDIALVRLNGSLNFSETLRPVCLPPGNGSSMGLDRCYSSGYGYLSHESEFTDNQLHYVAEARLPPESCSTEYPLFNATTNICIGGLAGRGTCNGDSGGPYQCWHEGRWYQQGLVSYGTPCALQGKPDVLTNVEWFHSWIVEQKDDFE